MVPKTKSKRGMGRGRGRPRPGDAPDPAHVARIAFTAFAIAGYDGASVREIAATAAVDPALVARRYGSKLGLWKATVDELAERMASMYDAIAQLESDPAPFLSRFQRVLRLFTDFCCEVPELGRFFTNEIAEPGDRRDYVLEQIWRPSFAVMQPWMRKAQAMGLIRAKDADILVFQLIGMVAMPLMMTSVMEKELGLDDDQIRLRLGQSVERLLLGA